MVNSTLKVSSGSFALSPYTLTVTVCDVGPPAVKVTVPAVPWRSLFPAIPAGGLELSTGVPQFTAMELLGTIVPVQLMVNTKGVKPELPSALETLLIDTVTPELLSSLRMVPVAVPLRLTVPEMGS